MSLNIETDFNEKEDKWLFLPIGEIDIHTSGKFKSKVIEMYKSKKTDILIDGERLTYVDSTGLGALIYILKSLKEDGHKIHLVNIKPNIKKLFSITELDKLFIIRSEENE